ncbi:MAG: stage 0 sporulation family protein [Defluviitaleaceae bacterium]|nr:stage 0 sporulation family protein [Defluviitaleaceae bacterium]
MEIVGVRFRKVGKIYYFDPSGQEIAINTPVIVDTVRGVEYGITVISNRHIENTEMPIKKILRLATEADTLQEQANREREEKAIDLCVEKIKEHGLDMHLVDVEVTFDLNKIIFYFTSDGRVDFRELVKSLASVFRMRIELRQIGVRDEAKILNGMGICGRTLCCATFLDEFQPVSIKMAKDQGMSLNPTKISGVCGRLMCCLKYEEETYEYLTSNLPTIGDWVHTPDGEGEVLAVNVLRQLAKVAVQGKKQEDAKVASYPIEDINTMPHKPQAPACGGDKAACGTCNGCKKTSNPQAEASQDESNKTQDERPRRNNFNKRRSNHTSNRNKGN